MVARVRRRNWSGGFVGKVVDLSSSGIFVAVPPDTFRYLSTVQLELHVPGTDQFLNCRAMVVRSTSQGVGMAFDQHQPLQLASLFRAGTLSSVSLPTPWQGL